MPNTTLLKNRENLVKLLKTKGYEVDAPSLNKKLEDPNYSTTLWSTLIADPDAKGDLLKLTPDLKTFRSYVTEEPAPANQGGLKKNNQVPTNKVGQQPAPTQGLDLAGLEKAYNQSSSDFTKAEDNYNASKKGTVVNYYAGAHGGELPMYRNQKEKDESVSKSQQDLDANKTKLDAVLNQFDENPVLKGLMEDAKKNISQFKTTNPNGLTSIDRSKLRDYANNYYKKNNIKIDLNGNFANTIHSKLLNDLNVEIVKPDIQNAFNIKFKKQFGKDFQTYIQDQSTTALEQQSAPIHTKYVKEAEKLKTQFKTQKQTVDQQYKQSQDQIDAKYNDPKYIAELRASIPEGVEIGEFIKAQYTQDTKDAYNLYVKNHSSMVASQRQINARYKSAYGGALQSVYEQFKKSGYTPTGDFSKAINSMYQQSATEVFDRRQAVAGVMSDFNNRLLPGTDLLFGRSVVAGSTNFLSNIATWMGNRLGYEWSTKLKDQAQDLAEYTALPANPLKSFGDLLDPAKVIQNVGEQLPNIGASIGLSLLARRPIVLAGGGRLATAIGGGVLSTIQENVGRQGQVEQQLLEQGTDLATAKEKSKQVWNSTIPSIAFNAIQLEAMFGKFGKGSMLSRFGANTSAELLTETPQEIMQTREEESATGVPEANRASVKDIFLNVAPSVIAMGLPGSARASVLNNESIAPAWVTNLATAPINKMAEQITKTSIGSMKGAVDFAAFDGLINPEKQQELETMLDNINTHVEQAKGNGLNKRQQSAYVTLVSTAEHLKNQADQLKANGGTEEEIKALEEKQSTASEAAKSLLANKSGNYAIVATEDGDSHVVTHDQLRDLMLDETFRNEVKSGSTTVDLKTGKKSTKPANDLFRDLYSLKKTFDQNQASYNGEAAALKSLRQRLGVVDQNLPNEYATVTGLIGHQVEYNDGVTTMTGELRQDGQTLVIENDKTIKELGNVNEFKGVKPGEVNLKYITPENVGPTFETKKAADMNFPGLVSLYAGKINPQTLLDTLMMVAPDADKNILSAQVYAHDNAYRQTNRRVEQARETDQDRRSPSKIAAPVAEEGTEYSGQDVAETVAEIGDKTFTSAFDKMAKFLGFNFIGQTIDLDELYRNDPKFAAKVEEQRTTKQDNRVDQSKKIYSNPESAPAVLIDGKVEDGYGRLAQLYINGDKQASAFVSTGKADIQNNTQAQAGNVNGSQENDIDGLINEVFGSPITIEELNTQAENARQILQAMVPDAEVVVHTDPASYSAAVLPIGGRAQTGGNAAFRKNKAGKTEVYRIDINASNANTRTVSHELAHAVLLNGFGINEGMFNQFKNQVSKILSGEDVQALNDFAFTYKSSLRAEEFLAELSGALRAGEVSPTLLSKIAQLINDFVRAITLGNFTPFEDVQKANDIIDMLTSLDPVTNNENTSAQEGSRSQGVTLMRGTETLKRFGLKPNESAKTRDVGVALEKRQRAKYGTINQNDRSPEAMKKISGWMVEEVKYFMGLKGDMSGQGWYGEKYQKALDAMSNIFPEMKTDENARSLFTMLVAITSDGQKVLTNFKLASIAYDYYKNNGKLPETLPGQRIVSFEANLSRINEMLVNYNGDIAKMKEDLMKVSSIKDINAQRKSEGLSPLKSDWPVEFQAPFAASVFGPKLGMFFSNLSGNEAYPTLDRWWSRTFNRYRGTLIPDIKDGYAKDGTPIGIQRLKDLLGDSKMSNEDAFIYARNYRDSYAAKNYKDGTEIEKAANTIYKNAFDNLNDAPQNKTDRQFMYDSVQAALKSLKRQGYDLTIADVQAILWYFEKNLYKTLGVRANITGISYEEAANITFEKWSASNKSFDYTIQKEEDIASVEDADDQIEDEENGIVVNYMQDSGSRSQEYSTQMVSPNEMEGTALDDSIAKLGTPEMTSFMKAMGSIDKIFGFAPDTQEAVGVWSDGAEQSSVARYKENIDFDTLKAMGAVKGLMSNQKAVLNFKADEIQEVPDDLVIGEGKGFLFEFAMPGDAKTVTKSLTDAGLEYKTVAPVGNSDTMIYLYTDEIETFKKYIKFVTDNNIQHEHNYGQGEFTGTWGEREEAYDIYNGAIEQYVSKANAESQWIGDLKKEPTESIADYRARAAKIISERSGDEVTYGSRSQAVNPVEQLRAEEQAEYDSMADPNDEVKKKEIYDKYDKLITPLLESENSSRSQQPISKVDKFITAARNRGFSEQTIETALQSKLGMSAQDAQNALMGNQTNAGQQPSTPSAKAQGKFVSFFKEQFAAFGNLGKEIGLLREQMDGSLSAQMFTAMANVNKVEKLIKASNVAEEDIDEFLRGGTPQNAIPIELADQLSSMRMHIDNLTDQLINMGLVSPDMIATLEANKGQYLTRSYELFNSKDVTIDNITNKLKSVDEQVVNAAMGVLYEEQIKHVRQMYPNASPKEQQDMAMASARTRANTILAQEGSDFKNAGKLGAKDLSFLQSRKDISPEIRALMGEYTDPIYNYAKTVFKLANTVSAQAFLTEAAKTGLGKIFFQDDVNRPEGATYRIAGDQSDVMSPLNGLYTYPEVGKEFETHDAKLNDALSLIFAVAGTVRKYKTVYNPMTHVKNVIGNVGFVIANGHFGELGQTWEFVSDWVQGKENQKLFDLATKLHAQGVLNSSIGSNEIRSYFDNSSRIENSLSTIGKQNGNWWSRTVGKALKKGGKWAEDMYQKEDDIYKLMAFLNESNRYSKAMYGKTYDQLSDTEMKSIDDKVTDIVKNTYPTFSRTPKFVKTLSKGFFLGNFLSFQVESVRVSYNTLKLANEELQSGNPNLMKLGAMRIAGTAVSMSIPTALTYYGSMLAGMGLSGLAGFMAGDDDEEKKKAKARERATRKFAHPFNKEGDLMVVSAKDGELTYYDVSSSDPRGYPKEIWNAFWNNMNDKEGFAKSAFAGTAQALSPYLDPDMTLKGLTGILYNQDSFGSEIYDQNESTVNKVLKIGNQLRKSFQPGVISAIERPLTAGLEGDKEKMGNELAAQATGMRAYKIDVLKKFTRSIYETAPLDDFNPTTGFAGRIKKGESYYRSVVNNKKATVAEKDAAYKEANERVSGALKDLKEYYDGAIALGVAPGKLNQVLMTARLGKTEIYSIITGNYNVPYMPRRH